MQWDIPPEDDALQCYEKDPMGTLEQEPEIMASWLDDMYIQLELSPEAAKLLIKEQGQDIPERLRILTNKNVDDICNVMRKTSSKNANETPDRRQQVSVIAQEACCHPIPS